jgi:small neutral amino acid transporter SnatA (MarC family)
LKAHIQSVEADKNSFRKERYALNHAWWVLSAATLILFLCTPVVFIAAYHADSILTKTGLNALEKALGCISQVVERVGKQI